MADISKLSKEELIERKQLLERKLELENQASLDQTEPIQSNKESVDEKIASRQPIQFRSPKGIVDPAFAIQNIGALAQREEAAISGAIREVAKPGLSIEERIKAIPQAGKQFMRGLAGEQQTEIGDLIRERGGTETQAKVIGFLGSLGLPTNLAITAATGGSGNGVITGATKDVGKNIGRLARGVAKVETSKLKEFRNIINKRGVAKVFSPEVESKEFIGKFATPKVTESIKNKALSFNKNTIKELAPDIADETIDSSIEMAKKMNLTKIPTVSQADDFFRKTLDSVPDGTRFGISKVSSQIDNIASEITDKPISKQLSTIAKQLRGSMSQEDLILGKSGTIDVKDYIILRNKLVRMRPSDPKIARFVDEAKTIIDDAASQSIPQIDFAKNVFKISRRLEKVVDKVSRPNFDKAIQTKIKQAAQQGNTSAKESLKRLMGDEADEIIDLLDANRLLNDSVGGLGKLRGEGLFSIMRGVAKRGMRSSEEKFIPKLNQFGKAMQGPSQMASSGLGLVEKAIFRRLAQQENQ